MDEILKELEKYRKEGYEFHIGILDDVDVIIIKKDVHLKDLWQFETIEDALKGTLKWIYMIKKVPHSKRVKL